MKALVSAPCLQVPGMLGRRGFLKATGVFAAAATLALRSSPAADAAQVRKLTPVAVSLDRVTRTTVGLRPYRAGGFVLRAEGRDGKTIVHDFGHGGGGMSLSWGTALLALELAMATEKRRAAVIGCGVIGLSTARVLQDAGFDVTIYARAIPPNTTSNMSGAQWTPTSVFNDERVDDAFRTTFARAARLAYLRYQTLLGDDYGIRWIENYDCYDEADDPFPGGAATALIRDLYPEVQTYGPGEHPFPTRYARRFLTMLIEPNRYLRALLRDYALRGGRIVIRDFGSAADLLALDEPLVMNCTGLGAKALTGDTQLEPIRGQLSVLAPQPGIDYITLHGGHYMFPRSDGIVLGVPSSTATPISSRTQQPKPKSLQIMPRSFRRCVREMFATRDRSIGRIPIRATLRAPFDRLRVTSHVARGDEVALFGVTRSRCSG